MAVAVIVVAVRDVVVVEVVVMVCVVVWFWVRVVVTEGRKFVVLACAVLVLWIVVGSRQQLHAFVVMVTAMALGALGQPVMAWPSVSLAARLTLLSGAGT